MAALNEISGIAARYQQLLSRKFGIIGGSPSPQLTPEITPVVSFPSQPEDVLLRNERGYGGFTTQAGAAGTQPICQLRNPAGSGVLIITEYLNVCDVAVASGLFGVSMLVSAAEIGAPLKASATDKRNSSQSVGTMSAATAAPYVPNMLYGVRNVEGLILTLPLIIPPGWAVQMGLATNNRTAIFDFYWREIPMTPGEFPPL